MADPDFGNREEEYWFHVSPQDVLPLAGKVEVDIDLDRVFRFFALTARFPSHEIGDRVAALLIEQSQLFSEIRQFLGISDKRAYLDLSYIASRIRAPDGNSSLCGCQPWTLARHPLRFFVRLLEGHKGEEIQNAIARMMSEYLLRHGLEQSAASFGAMSIPVLEMLYARLITPKEYQQRAAKRRGHGCEAALASLLYSLGIDIFPPDKASNPMGARDPNVDLATMRVADRSAGHTHSFDMIVNRDRRPRILVQSLIHTSDPGQYGVNKSDETVAINGELRAWSSNNPHLPVELWALLDGVGFSENKPDTINKLLRNVDFFVQLRSLYKAALRAHYLGLSRIEAIRFSDAYSKFQRDQLIGMYVPLGVDVLDSNQSPPANSVEVPAGNAVLFVDKTALIEAPLPELQNPLVE